MNRRQLILAFGTVVGGAGIGFGTGAFTANELSDRQASVTVTNDAQSLIALVPNNDLRAVRLKNGELIIGLDDPGLNQGSIYQFGYFAEKNGVGVKSQSNFPYTQDNPSNGDDFGSAFLIRNQTISTQTLEIEFKLTAESAEDNADISTSMFFEIHNDDVRTLFSGSHTETVELGSGEAVGISFLLDVPEGALGESIDGSLSVTAGEAVNS